MHGSRIGSQISQITAVAIPVANPDRALDFYTSALGFEKRRDVPFGQGLRWIEVAPSGAATTIALAPPGPKGGSGVDTGIRLLTSDSQADHDSLRDRGVDVDEIIRYPNVPPMFSFRDPDGNTLYVVESTGS
jgi:catechol 2,3-dioxygenase-like lactoylglutathione lyase family enzyme